MNKSSSTNASLRQQTEEHLKTQNKMQPSDTDMHKLLHELQVHQIELEMQNKALMESNSALCKSNKDLEEAMERNTDLYDFSPTGLVNLDHTGTIIQINHVCAHLLKTEINQLTGARFGLFISQRELPKFNKLLRKVFLLGTRQSCDVSLSGTSTCSSTLNIEAMLSNDGQQCRATVVDISKRKQLEDELTNYQTHLLDMVTERTANLTIAAEIADGANRTKSEFLASMSHEIRTPMNIVLGFAQLLELEENLSTDQESFVQEILLAGNHLLSLINEILDLPIVESGLIELTLEHIDLPELIDECGLFIQPLLSNKSLNFNTKLSKQLTTVYTDKIRLKQVLINLLSNAIKYNKDSGSIRIEVQASPIKPEHIRISVKDNGVGIAPERISGLFQPFNHVARDKSSIEGTGIGLCITRNLVELMHGIVNIESELGVGTSVWFELPSSARV
jgi:signal transduction histidine kinase